jgi:monoamine oxidase
MAASGSRDNPERIDIAVVGGGVAGTYCCWRLQTAQTGRTAVLFEMDDHIGGRLLSLNMPGIPGVVGELGGMRFLSLQRMVCSLVEYLQLSVSDFPMGGPMNIATLRGVRLRNAVFEYPQIVPYRLLPSEQGLSPGALLVKAIETIIPDATKLTPQQWEYTKQTVQWNGDYLYNWGLWNVLLSTDYANQKGPPILSSEAYALLYDGGGYESLVDNWNCAEAFEYLLIDFPKDAQYLRLPKGYQTLPVRLAERFTDAGGTVNLQHRLVTFTPNEINGATVIDLEVMDDASNATRYYRANALILAMPQRSLEILAQKTPVLDSDDVRELLKSVMSMPAYKSLALYDSPWWKKPLGVEAGRSTTDLPLRQVYYMYTADPPPSEDPPNNNSLMLATYADGRTESFWDRLSKGPKGQKKFRNTPNRFVPQMDARRIAQLERYRAPDDFTRTLHSLTVEMHQLPPDQIPLPYDAFTQDWNKDPFGGGWHFWRPGIKVWERLPRMRQPIDSLPVHICGESYANQQGWVEGALTSAEHVVQKYFGLPTPRWLDPQDYFIGP